MFSCEFGEISKNIFFTEYVWVTASLPDGTKINNDYINVINSTKTRYRIENSVQTENTERRKTVYLNC